MKFNSFKLDLMTSVIGAMIESPLLIVLALETIDCHLRSASASEGPDLSQRRRSGGEERVIERGKVLRL